MKIIKLNGNLVKLNGKFETLTLPPREINLLTFGDGVEFTSVPSITGNKTITATFFIKNATSKFTLWFHTAGVNDYLFVDIGNVAETGLFGMTVQTRSSPSTVRRYYNINSYLNQIVNLEIIKTATAITSVKMNTNTLSPTTGFFSPPDTTVKNFGGLDELSIWDLEIVGSHLWKGYNYGNTNAAWIDTIGGNNGTVTGTPGTKNLVS